MTLLYIILKSGASQVMLVVGRIPVNAGDIRERDLIPGLRRSPGGKDGNSLQYSCLGNSMDRGAWWATVNRVSLHRRIRNN